MHPAELSLAQGAAATYGVFTKRRALAAGLSPRTITRRLQVGEWLLLHPNVYCFASTSPGWERDEIAACYWSRGVAVGKAAGRLFELPGCEEAPVEVITRHKLRVMPMLGVIVRVTNRLPADQITTVRNIPTTTIERTLMSLCAQFDRRRAGIALDNALFRGLTTIGQLDHLLFRTARQGRNGCRVLRDLIKIRNDVDEVPNSPLESVILELFVSAGIEMPKLQYPIYDDEGRFVARPDFVYPREKVVIEGHSKLWHTGNEAEQHDRLRHLRLVDLGYEVIYLGWSDATRYANQTIERIERARTRSESVSRPELAAQLSEKG